MRRIKIVIYALFFTGMIGGEPPCQAPFNRNPNLLQVKVGEFESYYLPIYSPSGEYLYFIKVPIESGLSSLEIYEKGGSLYRTTQGLSSGFPEEEVLKGEFAAFDISVDGNRIAVVEGNAETGGMIKIVDLKKDTTYLLPTTQDSIIWVKFSKVEDKIYYAALDEPSGYYRISLDGSGEELVRLEKNPRCFDLTHKDSIYDDGAYPALNPADEEYVVMVYPEESYGNILLDTTDVSPQTIDLILVNRFSNDTTFLDARPYQEARIVYPSWSPDGRNIVFSCKGVFTYDPITYRSEIWIIKNVK